MKFYIEIIAVIFSFLSVFFATRKNILTWPFGIVGITAYTLIFVELKMPAQIVLQAIFLIQSLYGWYMWNKPNEELEIQSLDDPELFLMVASQASMLSAMLLMMNDYTKHPFLDSASAIFSIFASFFLANKVIQTWLYWSMVNIMLIIVFYSESMYPSAILYFVFLIMSIFGYFSWRKDLKTA